MGIHNAPRKFDYNLIGQHRIFNHTTQKYEADLQEFKYKELGSYTETTIDDGDDLQTLVSDMSIATFSNITFRSKDKIIDHFKRDFEITDVLIEPHTNSGVGRFRNSQRFQRKILFLT